MKKNLVGHTCANIEFLFDQIFNKSDKNILYVAMNNQKDYSGNYDE